MKDDSILVLGIVAAGAFLLMSKQGEGGTGGGGSGELDLPFALPVGSTSVLSPEIAPEVSAYSIGASMQKQGSSYQEIASTMQGLGFGNVFPSVTPEQQQAMIHPSAETVANVMASASAAKKTSVSTSSVVAPSDPISSYMSTMGALTLPSQKKTSSSATTVNYLGLYSVPQSKPTITSYANASAIQTSITMPTQIGTNLNLKKTVGGKAGAR